MKKFLCLLSLLFCVLSLQGQQRLPEKKVVVKSLEIVPVWKIAKKMDVETPLFTRLYRRPNTRVRKALSFQTVQSRPAMA